MFVIFPCVFKTMCGCREIKNREACPARPCSEMRAGAVGGGGGGAGLDVASAQARHPRALESAACLARGGRPPMRRGRGGVVGTLPPAARVRALGGKRAGGQRRRRQRRRRRCTCRLRSGMAEALVRERPVCVSVSACLLGLLWAAAGPVRSAEAGPSARS